MRISTLFLVSHFPLIVCLLTVFTFVIPCRLRVRAKAVWIMGLLLCASKGVVFEAFGGHPISPSVPQPLIWAWNLAGSFLLVLFALSLVWWVRKGRVWILPVTALALAAWGQYEGTRPPPLRQLELSFPDLPRELNGYRILQISDIHCSSAARAWRTKAIVRTANEQNPDLVCLTGDYVDGRLSYLERDLDPLKGLRAKDGVYCIRGNHEYYLDRYLWREWFLRNGFRFLVNECAHPRPSLALGGVNYTRASRFRDVDPDVGAAFASATNGEFRVLLEHTPINAERNAEEFGVDLQLSGHTHGGVSPGISWLVSRYNRGYLNGLYQIGRMTLYVNPGAGMWAGFPMRFFNPSEITLITLRKGRP